MQFCRRTRAVVICYHGDSDGITRDETAGIIPAKPARSNIRCRFAERGQRVRGELDANLLPGKQLQPVRLDGRGRYTAELGGRMCQKAA
jgi:hypothetical protein